MSQAHALKDLTGQVFGRLTVIRRDGSDTQRAAMWLCKCTCGTKTSVIGAMLRRGSTVSCGCYGKEMRAAAKTKHGGAKRDNQAPEYAAWAAMHSRCSNENDPNFEHYGGRGICVCPEWQDFGRFIADMGPRPFPKATIERQDNFKGYSPDNCCWASMKQQARNKRTNVPVERSDGRRFGTMVEAGEETGVHPTGIRAACSGKQKTAGGYGWKFCHALTALQSKDETNVEGV